MDANAAAQSNWDAYQRGLDAGHRDYIDTAVKCDEYYRGEQWDEEVRKQLESEGRPALTINAVLAAVNTVLGEYSTQRADITFKPRGNAQQETADALTKQVLQIQDNNRYQYKEAQVFSDGLIQDRGWFDVRMDFGDSMQGEVRITDEDPICVIPDPQGKDYDPRTWNEVLKTKWMTPDEIALLYGKQKGEEVKGLTGDSVYGQDSVRYAQQTFGDVDTYEAYPDVTTEGRAISTVRVIERQYYQLTPVKFFVDPNTGDMREVNPAWDDARIQAFAQKFQLFVHRKLARRVRWRVTADRVVLHDAFSPYKTFTLILYAPYFRRGRPFGMVRNLLSPQEQLNKVESQQLHVVNTTANSGWIVQKGSLTNMTTDDLEERGAETGLVLEYARTAEKPDKIQPNQIPTGLDRLGSKALTNIREIAGVTTLLGLESPEVSGVALKQKQSRGLVQMQVPFDNLQRTRQILAEKILELVQQFYTETRVFRVTNYGNPEAPNEEVTINGMSPEGEVINNVTLGEYDVVVSSVPARDTFQDTQFAEALNLREIGVAIPDHWVILNSNLADKRAIAQEVMQQQGLAAPTEEEMALQQQQLQMAIAQSQLELGQMQAEIEKLQSEAALNFAKAQAAVGDTQIDAQRLALDAQSEAARLQADMIKKMADLQNKLQLAGMHIQAKRAETLHTTASKRFSEELNNRMQLQKQAMAQQAKPAPAAKK